MEKLDNAVNNIVNNTISGLKTLGLAILAFSVVMEFLSRNVF
jgi:hypothetical protein